MGKRREMTPEQHAIEQIVSVMSGKEWSADTLDAIAEIVREAGYEIQDVDDSEE